MHAIINNQIGYTTTPLEARSSRHATDVAKVVGAPIFHANADDPEAVCLAFNYAAEWRQHFECDVVVDVVGYRRQGHNEQDEPRSTLPQTHRLISEHPRVFSIYKSLCVDEGAVTETQIERWQQTVRWWPFLCVCVPQNAATPGLGSFIFSVFFYLPPDSSPPSLKIDANFAREYQKAQDGEYRETEETFLKQSMVGVLGESRLGQEATGLPIPTLQVRSMRVRLAVVVALFPGRTFSPAPPPFLPSSVFIDLLMPALLVQECVGVARGPPGMTDVLLGCFTSLSLSLSLRCHGL